MHTPYIRLEPLQKVAIITVVQMRINLNRRISDDMLANNKKNIGSNCINLRWDLILDAHELFEEEGD